MNKPLKYILLALVTFAMQEGKSQLLLPNFEAPKSLKILNTESEEIAPVPFSNGEKLYFVRYSPEGKAKNRKAGQEIWTAERNGQSWSEPKNLFKEANDLGNNGVIGSSSDGNKIYVFNSIQSRRKLARGIAFVEKQDDGTWSDLKKLKIDGFEIGDGYYSFYMNQAEDVLLISMAPNKKTINEDLFVSTKNNEGEWSTVASLGDKINTDGIELSPFVTADKNALYFASNGHGGEGGVDIFVSYRLGDGWTNWTEPKNLGKQINSSAFDAYFMIGNNKEVFFVSNRDSSMGDVYTTKLVEAKTVQLANNEVNGQFLYKGLAQENVKLEVYDEFGNIVDTIITDASGNFSYRKLKAEENYFIRVAADDASEYPNAVLYEFDENGEKSNRYILTKSGLFINSKDLLSEEIVVGSFEYNNLPLENTYVLVYDESGEVVDTIITDGKGNFAYKKLDPDGNYTFKPLSLQNSDDVLVNLLDPELDMQGSFTYKSLPLQNEALLVLNEDGEIIDTIYTDAKGNFNYKKLNADDNFSFKPVDYKDDELAFDYIVEAPKENQVKGTLNYKKLPLINVPLLVKDENGVVVDTIYTDAYGKFEYEKLQADGEYTFTVIEQNDDPDLIDFAFQDAGKEKVEGTFNYKSLPLQNEALIVMDENGFPIDTIYTDMNGKFTYNKLRGDNNYTIKLLNEEDMDAEFLVMDFGELNEEKIGGTFNYKNLPLQNEALVVFDENGLPVDTIYTDINGKFSYTKLKGEDNFTFKLLNDSDKDMTLLLLDFDNIKTENNREIVDLVQQEQQRLIIYFNFNEMEIDAGDRNVLKQVISQKERINKIILEGHTDDVGTHSQNLRVARERVNSAFKYLVSEGVSESLIEKKAIGEERPVTSNTTNKGRAQNRRVVIILK